MILICESVTSAELVLKEEEGKNRVLEILILQAGNGD